MTKEKTPSQPTNTIAMAGDNEYNENSDQQYLAMKACLPLFEGLTFGPNATFVDYGCSQGAASMVVMQKLVSQLPPHSTVTVAFNDLPSNDFNSLIKLLPSIAPADSTKVIYPHIVPNSFYNPVMPNGTVDIAYAMSSIHWLRQMPLPKTASESFKEYLHRRSAENTIAAHKDLIEFLRLRGREVKPGGKLIVAAPSPCADDTDGRISGNEKLRLALFEAIDILMDAGKLPPNSADGIYPPSHVHTEQTFRAAVKETNSEWLVEDVYNQIVPHSAYQTMLESRKQTKDPQALENFEKAYASIVVDWMLAVFKPFMKSWWIGKGLEEGLCEEVFQECSNITKEEFVNSGGSRLPVAQDFVFVKLGRSQRL
ncbi:hypothetical protein TWF718_010457 [Orbilia javanica]|uniref:S-adenosyl-L-methionine-dependent methyltransferase n=1 Tax=Orbilia javanica TaxID=47235 RepID=A0AAN8MPA5_9PEZI